MLNRHPMVAIPLESLFVIDYLRVADRVGIHELKALMIKEPEIREWGLRVTPSDLDGCDTVTDCIVRLHQLYAAPKGAQAWGQKTPRFVRHLELITECFSGARFIHVVRDPRAVASSLILSDVHRSDAYHAAHRWLTDVQLGLNFERAHPEVVLRLRYEDLVRDPGLRLRQALDFLGLDPALIPPDGAVTDRTGEYSQYYANIHANLSRQPTADFVDKWRRELSAEELEVVEAICGVQMRDLGYEPDLTSPRVVPGMVRRLKVRRVFLAFLQFYRYLRYRRLHLLFLLWRKWRLGLLREFFWTVNY